VSTEIEQFESTNKRAEFKEVTTVALLLRATFTGTCIRQNAIRFSKHWLALHSHPATDERKVDIHLRRLSVIFHFKRILECPSVDNTISEFFDHLKADAFELLPSMDDTWK